MTTITHGRVATLKQAAQFAPGLVGRVKYYVERSRAERQLRQMDDRMLADIGLHRGDIDSVIWGS